MIVIWNDINGSIPENFTHELPEDRLFIVRPKSNSLQNRFLPMNLIRTDAVLTLDDDVRISNYDFTLAFRWSTRISTANSAKLALNYSQNRLIKLFSSRAWQEHPTNIVGFITRNVGRNKFGRFEYQGQTDCHYNLVLTGASFFHRYYLYVRFLWRKIMLLRVN